MTIPKITPYSGGVANPDGSQTQTEFTQNMFDQLSYEANLATELDATIDGMNNAVDEVNASASSAENSANAAEAAASGLNYKGLWPDTGGSANKGDTYQTQVSGTGTGQYFTALQNTTVDPAGDGVNWRSVVSVETISNYTDIVYKSSGGNSAVENMLLDFNLNPLARDVGTIIKTGGMTWVYEDQTGSITEENFRAFNVTNAYDFGAVGDKIADDTVAIQKAIDFTSIKGGTVFLPGYHITSSPLQWRTGVSITGTSSQRPAANSGSTIANSTSDIFEHGIAGMFGATISGLTIISEVGGGHIFKVIEGQSRCEYKNCSMIQRNPGKSILDGSALVTGYFGNWWHHNYLEYENANTVPAFNLVANGAATINQNIFERSRIARPNITTDGDYAFHIETTSASTFALDNEFNQITFQQPGGGAINLLGCWNTVIDAVGVYDLPAGSANPMVNIASGVGGATSRNTSIKGSFIRVGGSTVDIMIDGTQAGASVKIESSYVGIADANGGIRTVFRIENSVVTIQNAIYTTSDAYINAIPGAALQSYQVKYGNQNSNDGTVSFELNGSYVGHYTSSGNFFWGGTIASPDMVITSDGRVSAQEYLFEGATNRILTGSGSPEGVISATRGSMYTNKDGGVGATLYVKETGSGNTGWAAK